MKTAESSDALVYGADPEPGLVAVEWMAGRTQDRMRLFVRGPEGLTFRDEPFEPFVLVSDRRLAEACADVKAVHSLEGDGALRFRVDFATWRALQKAKAPLARAAGATPNTPDAPYLFINDAVQQHLLRTGHTLFKGLEFDGIRRLGIDIECHTAPGYEFCNAQREEDRIIAIALVDNTGWERVLGPDLDEADLLAAFVACVQERDPDVIEGHNLFNFDLPYLAARAARHSVALKLGRDHSEPNCRPSRFSVGERVLSYTRFDIFGRHVVDTLFLTQAYDAVHRSLEGYGLKEVAIHFGLAAPDRTYIEGPEIARVWREDPERLRRYVLDDAREAERLSRTLSASVFLQARMLPYSYQNICVRGNATKIDALLIREYLRQGAAVPLPAPSEPFAGGYTDVFRVGVVRNVHHVDVRSLYPSLMLAHEIGPRRDTRKAFLGALDRLRTLRLDAKARLKQVKDERERSTLDALQSTFKVLINSFYGYLGFEQAHFNDYAAAERVTREGRELLRSMIAWLRAHHAEPIEIDTDGIYFVPPAFKTREARDGFRRNFEAMLPPGIEVEFDGEYPAMFSYKMKNYALLHESGEITIRGAALKSRGLEPFQRDFMEAAIRLKLEGREGALGALRDDYRDAIRNRTWDIRRLAKTETLQDAPGTYAAKVGKGGRARSAAYELVARSDRIYRAGDQVSYYVTGKTKSVPVHSNSRLVSDWNPANRDENIAYYLSKLDALYEKMTHLEGEAGEEADLFGARPDAPNEE